MKRRIAGETPISVGLEAGKTYAWYSCGLSTNQTFFDVKHAGSAFTSVRFTAE